VPPGEINVQARRKRTLDYYGQRLLFEQWEMCQQCPRLAALVSEEVEECHLAERAAKGANYLLYFDSAGRVVHTLM